MKRTGSDIMWRNWSGGALSQAALLQRLKSTLATVPIPNFPSRRSEVKGKHLITIVPQISAV